MPRFPRYESHAATPIYASGLNQDSMQTIDNRQVTEAKMANARITPLNSAF